MCDVTREQHIAALEVCQYVEDPTLGQMLAVCPHLTQEQLEQSFMVEGAAVAVPSIKVKGSFWTANYFRSVSNREPSIFSVSLHCRTLSSYGSGQRKLRHYPFPVLYQAEAMAYAEEHWPESLVLDNWEGFVQVDILDPSTVISTRLEGLTFYRPYVIYVGLKEKWSTLWRSGRVGAGAWDNAIAITTLNCIEGQEIKGYRGVHHQVNCAHCGGGLGLGVCHGCGVNLPLDRSKVGYYGDAPLPMALRQLLEEHGHHFQRFPGQYRC